MLVEVEGLFCFAVQSVYSAEKENSLQSLLFADILTVKRQILSVIPLRNTFLEVYRKKRESQKRKSNCRKYFTFISITQL